MSGKLASSIPKIRPEVLRKKIIILTTEWHTDIIDSLYEGAHRTLLAAGYKNKHIVRQTVSGSFELPLAALVAAEKKQTAGVIALGCIIQGETPHFTFISQSVANGLQHVSLKTKKPVVFGVLTTLNKQQASARAGGKKGNKGEESTLALLSLLQYMG